MIIFTLNHEVNARKEDVYFHTESRGKCTSDTRPLGRVSIILPSWLSEELSHLHFLLRLLHRIPERRRLIILLHAVVALHDLLHPGRLGALSLPRLLSMLLA